MFNHGRRKDSTKAVGSRKKNSHGYGHFRLTVMLATIEVSESIVQSASKAEAALVIAWDNFESTWSIGS